MKKDIRFTIEEKGTQDARLIQVITDTQTGVQYMLATYPNIGSGLTVMLDADGKPLLAK